MIDFFFALKAPIGCSKLGTVWNLVLSKILLRLYPIYCSLIPPKLGITESKREQQIIISFTSFPQRFSTLYLCVRSLLNQSMKPDRIILWLAKEQCAGIPLPASLQKLTQYGLEIKYCPEDIRPHKKTYYSFQRFPNDIIVSVDDDELYDSHLVERLFYAHQEKPQCICCTFAHKITLRNKVPDLYDEWVGGCSGEAGVSYYYVAIGCGGILYPPGSVDSKYFDMDLLTQYALSADDLWLKFAEIRAERPVYKFDAYAKYAFTIEASQISALTKVNNGQKTNDKIIKQLTSLFPLDWEHLDDEL